MTDEQAIIEELRSLAETNQSPGDRQRNLFRQAANYIEDQAAEIADTSSLTSCLAAQRQRQTDALKIAREALEGMVEYTGKRESWQDDNPQYVTAVRDAIDVINAALKETT